MDKHVETFRKIVGFLEVLKSSDKARCYVKIHFIHWQGTKIKPHKMDKGLEDFYFIGLILLGENSESKLHVIAKIHVKKAFLDVKDVFAWFVSRYEFLHRLRLSWWKCWFCISLVQSSRRTMSAKILASPLLENDDWHDSAPWHLRLTHQHPRIERSHFFLSFAKLSKAVVEQHNGLIVVKPGAKWLHKEKLNLMSAIVFNNNHEINDKLETE